MMLDGPWIVFSFGLCSIQVKIGNGKPGQFREPSGPKQPNVKYLLCAEK
jgi:hypothetical protein